MTVRRILLGIISLGAILSAAGCSGKATPTKMENAVKADRAISQTIMDRISKDVALSDNSQTFQVLTVKGQTTLYGVVNNELERSHAEQIATDTKGVTGVTSRIRLANQPVQTASTSTNIEY